LLKPWLEKEEKEEDTKFITLPKSNESEGSCHQKDKTERVRWGEENGIEATQSSSLLSIAN